MGAILQCELRLHEGILASLNLQAATRDQHVQDCVRIATSLEDAIDNFKAAVIAEQTDGQIQIRLLQLLFNLEEMIQGLKDCLDAFLICKQQLERPVFFDPALLDSHASAIVEGIDWMENLAESWSLSLDETRMSGIKALLINSPRVPSDIRDWRTVLDEVASDAEIRD